MPPSPRELAAKYHLRQTLRAVAAGSPAAHPAEGAARDEPPCGASGTSVPDSAKRDRWSPDASDAFRRMAPHAIAIVGTAGPISATVFNALGEEVQRIGGNRGVWPMKIALTTAWKDTVTATYNRVPFCWIGTLFRVWTETDAHQRQLAVKCAELLGVYRENAWGETMMAGFVDVGPEIQVPFLEMEIHSIARQMGFATWDDDGLKNECERRARARAGIAMGMR